jgi:NAD(P)-dependent dehydrogenase (short-subunit alcohol dehydrogenase family)
MAALENKVAVITGSSRGFGLAIAWTYAEAGATVVISSRTPSSVEQAVSALQAEGHRALGVPCDVSDLAQVKTLARRTLDAFGQLDIWVNNAGISGPYGPTVHLSPETFTQVLQTDIFGVYHGSLVAMRHFLQQKDGKLINMLGRGASNPTPYQNAYASSKTWVRSFTLALAKEYQESGVSVLAYNPGMMTTDMLTSVSAVEGYEEKLKIFPTIIRMWAKPPEVPAKRMVTLASAQTDGQTGKVIKEMSVPGMLWGAVREGARRLFGSTDSEIDVAINTVPSAFPVGSSSQQKEG